MKNGEGMSENNITILSDTFELYMKKGKEAKERGNLALAKRNFLLASETMMQIAVRSKGKLKEVRMERARKLVDIADNLGKKPAKIDKKSDVEEEKDETLKKWQTAEIPKITFNDVAGLEDVKKAITIKMINPVKYPEKYKMYGKKTGGGVLLYGPPGTGKTMIAKAIANEVGAKFYAVKGSDIVSKWVGDSEKNINSLFEEANKQDRAIIFIDEMDSLIGKRGLDTHNDKRVNEFLQQIDGFAGRNPNLLLLGATNRPWDIDSAAMRSGRFSQKIYLPLPDAAARKYMLEKNMKRVPVAKDFNIDRIVAQTENYSGADIEELCDRAKDEPLLQAIATDKVVLVTNEDFDRVLDSMPPSVTEKEISSFEAYNTEISSYIKKNKKTTNQN
ncbi:MAG: ATP-binding protein [Clostridia bacterium]|nr:ATP-binding protein [Clostridia bacterium]